MEKNALKNLWERSLRMLRGLKFTAVVLSLLIAAYLSGLIIPQKWMFASNGEYEQWLRQRSLNGILDALGLTDIFLSPLVVTLLALFFLNLVIVLASRFRIVGRRMYLGEQPEIQAEALRKTGVCKELGGIGQEDAVRRIGLFFRRRRWSFLKGKQEGTFLALRNRYSPVGFILFHVSFLLCLAGGVTLGLTRFAGKVVLTEGQEFNSDIGSLKIVRNAKLRRELPPIGFLLENIQPRYEKGVPTELVTELQVSFGGKVGRERIRINEPVTRGPYTVLEQRLGVSPLFVVTDRSGRELDGAFVSLRALKEGDEDSFRLNFDPDIIFYARFYPDYEKKAGNASRSPDVHNPAFHLLIKKDTAILYEGTLRIGDSADAGAFRITFREWRYWIELLLVREYGELPLIAGFFLACLGLLIRFGLYQRHIRLALQQSDGKLCLFIDGKSEFYQEGFAEELRIIKEKLFEFMEGEHVRHS